ncbi:MAG: transglycosylase SLT domain-containing protein [Spirochaetes bacterium]|nr:transglycosylase SLT domain-containing protein [Spirochaetota bacterium]
MTRLNPARHLNPALILLALTLAALTLAPTPFVPQPYRVLTRPRDVTPARIQGIPIEFYAYFVQAAEETRFPMTVLRDLIARAENTRWNPAAESPVRSDGHRDRGLCQHNSKYVAYFAERYNNGIPYNPMNPAEAIPVTARILADNLARLGSLDLSVAAYRQGVDGVRSNGPDMEYVNKILGGTA